MGGGGNQNCLRERAWRHFGGQVGLWCDLL
nr:MAG TPA: hypothetical protein [Myoviridae sp. ctTfa5]